MTTGIEPMHEDSSGRSGGHRSSTILGAVIGLVGLAFVARTFIQDRDDVVDALVNAQPALLPVAFVLGLSGMTGIGLAWRASLAALGGDLDIPSSLRGYFVGQLGKYVPGGIWAIVGRGEWARSKGVPATIAYSSVFLSMGTAYLAAVLLVATLVPLSGLLASDGGRGYALVLLLLPLGLVLLHPRIVRSTLTMMRRISGRELVLEVPSWGKSVRIVLLQIPSWILIGSVSVTLAAAFGSSGDVVNLISATAISWVFGFLVLPVPGGIGVREVVFVALATSIPTGVAAAVAIVARLVFISADASGALAMSAVTARRPARRRTSR